MMKSSISTILLALTTLSFVKVIESRRIVDGEQSAPKEFPYFVEMGGCGGSLIAPNVVLTAAHCGNQQGKQLLIGSYEIGTKGDDQETAWCEEWIPHPRYGLDGSHINNDFALCRLDKNVYHDTSKVESFGINFDPDFLNHDDNLIVMGLGALGEGEGGPKVLHDVVVPYVKNEICGTGEWYGTSVTTQMLCAGYEDGGKDSCQGDSGGPLIKRELRDGKFIDTQVGVVSWGDGCARAYKPGVYARTSAAAEWISNTLEKIESRQSESCEIEFEMEIETDELGYETTWTMENSWNERIKYRKYLAKKNVNRDRMCLQQNHCYTFEIQDSFGDATCYDECTPWSLSLLKNGEYSDRKFFEYSENFGDKLEVKFCVNDQGKWDKEMIHTDAPTEGPTGQTCGSDIVEDIDEAADIQASCDGNQEPFFLKFNIDKHGNELQWKLSRLENRGKSVVAGNYDCNDFPAYASVRAPANNEKYYCLDRSSEYIFEVFDKYGDGLSKSGLSGGEDPGYAGYLNNQKIFDGRNFNKHESKTFATNNAVAPDPTPAPTAAPNPVPTWPPTDATTLMECSEEDQDVTIYTIRHTNKKGREKDWNNKNCLWIGKNKQRCNKYKFEDKTTGEIINKKGRDLCPYSCGKKGLGVCSFLKFQ